MKPSKVLSAFLALLLMTNMSFAQNAKIKEKVSASARYGQILSNIQKGSIGHPEYIVTGALGTLVPGLNTLVIKAPGFAAQGSAAVAAGAATVGWASIIIGVASIYYGGKQVYKKYTYRSGKDTSSVYPKIAKALGDGKVFSEYKVLLTNANNPKEPHLAGPVLERLANFLGNPYKIRPIVDVAPIKDVDYRFYFDFPTGHPDYANKNVWADVNVGFHTVYVRSEGIRQPGQGNVKNAVEAKKKK